MTSKSNKKRSLNQAIVFLEGQEKPAFKKCRHGIILDSSEKEMTSNYQLKEILTVAGQAQIVPHNREKCLKKKSINSDENRPTESSDVHLMNENLPDPPSLYVGTGLERYNWKRRHNHFSPDGETIFQVDDHTFTRRGFSFKVRLKHYDQLQFLVEHFDIWKLKGAAAQLKNYFDTKSPKERAKLTRGKLAQFMLEVYYIKNENL